MVLRHILIEDVPSEPFADSAAILGPSHTIEPGYQVMQLLATTLSGRAVPTPEVATDVEAMAVKTGKNGGIAVLLLDRRAAATDSTTVAVALPSGSYSGTLHLLQSDSLKSKTVTRTDTPVSAQGTLRVVLPPNAVAVVELAP